ncbi:MAG: DUF6527 family protein [Balneola sp.]
MSKIKKVSISESRHQFQFFCPGCKDYHAFDDSWTFNGDLDNPHISPSLLIRSGTFAPNFEKKDIHPDWPDKFNYRCHSFIKNGKIQFLSDCSHSMKGQTVDLIDWDDIPNS